MNAWAKWLLAGTLLGGTAWGAPFEGWFDVETENGGIRRIWIEGDEFAAHFETEDGLPLVQDEATGRYVYAVPDRETGALLPTEVFLGEETRNRTFNSRLEGTPRHVRDTSEAFFARAREREEQLERELGTRKRWEEVKARAKEERRRGTLSNAPAKPERIVGVTILVDFPQCDDKGRRTNSLARAWGQWDKFGPEYFRGLLNGTDWKEDGNRSSVRGYFLENSRGHLDYTNVVIGWVEVPWPRSHYDRATNSCGDCGVELVTDVFKTMADDSPRWNKEYLPALRQATLTHGDSGSPRTLNVLFAGTPASTWDHGLWANRFCLTNKPPLTWKSTAGKDCRPYDYQITAVFSDPDVLHPVIGTLCHENGHMVCGFPDFYRYARKIGEKALKGFTNYNGVGVWSLMGSGNHLGNGCEPAGLDPYLTTTKGWVEPRDIAADAGRVSIGNEILRYAHPKKPKEYYLIENRRQTGRDSALPGEGILVWHVQEEYDNTKADPVEADLYEKLPESARNAKARWTSELALEQADGNYDLEQTYRNKGDAGDPWHAGSGKAFGDDTTPSARWYDAMPSGLLLSHFSEPADKMSLFVGRRAPANQLVTWNLADDWQERSWIPVGGTYGKLPENHVRPGLQIAGWYTHPEGGQEVSADSEVPPCSERTLYARWTNAVYGVEYGLGGGSPGAEAPVEAVFGTPFRVSPPTRPGHVFAGWVLPRFSGVNRDTARWGTSPTPTNGILPDSPFGGASDEGIWFLDLRDLPGNARLEAVWQAEGTPGAPPLPTP